MSSAAELKNLGNQSLTTENFAQAVEYYSKAIELEPSNHILYSNRSAAYAQWGKYLESLDDAKKTVELKPTWGKGYSRLGTAYTYLKDFDNARQAYDQGLAVDPNNDVLKKGLEDLDKFDNPNMENASNVMGDLFNNPQMKELLSDPAFLQKYLQHLQNPGSVPYDPKFDVLNNCMKNQYQQPPGSAPSYTPPSSSTTKTKSESTQQNTSSTAPSLSESEKEKDLGNAEYKKKNFEAALGHYNKALELEPTNITYINNIAATYLEMKEYKMCVNECKKAVDIGRENSADFKHIARAFARIGTAKYKMGKFDKAIEYYKRSLTEYRDPAIVKKLQSVEKEKKEAETKAYINHDIAEAERVKGNEMFSAGNIADAIKHYTESIKRNPDDHRVYSNRAACFIKVMEYSLAVRDCDTCIKLDPKFVKAYLRKGHAFLAAKQIFQAQTAFETALEVDPGNKEAYEGLTACNKEKNKLNPEELKELAMKDPEIQAIIGDPGMRVILEQMQTDPKATMTHLQNPEISKKIRKLIDCGVIQMR